MEQLQFWHTLLVKKTIELPIYIVHFILSVIRFISHITITHYLWVNLFTWLYFFIIHLAWHHQSFLVQICHTCFWIFFLLDDDDKKCIIMQWVHILMNCSSTIAFYVPINWSVNVKRYYFFVVYAIISTWFEKKKQIYRGHLYTVIVLLDTCSSGLYCL